MAITKEVVWLVDIGFNVPPTAKVIWRRARKWWLELLQNMTDKLLTGT